MRHRRALPLDGQPRPPAHQPVRPLARATLLRWRRGWVGRAVALAGRLRRAQPPVAAVRGVMASSRSDRSAERKRRHPAFGLAGGEGAEVEQRLGGGLLDPAAGVVELVEVGGGDGDDADVAELGMPSASSRSRVSTSAWRRRSRAVTRNPCVPSAAWSASIEVSCRLASGRGSGQRHRFHHHRDGAGRRRRR